MVLLLGGVLFVPFGGFPLGWPDTTGSYLRPGRCEDASRW
jgi:hypothetical protein